MKLSSPSQLVHNLSNCARGILAPCLHELPKHDLKQALEGDYRNLTNEQSIEPGSTFSNGCSEFF